MPQFNNFGHSQSQNQNSNTSMNQGSNQNPNVSNQNPNVNNGHNQGQNNNGTYGSMNQRLNQNRNQYQNQSQSQSQNMNQNGNQEQYQISGQHGRNQRNPFGFNRYGNSYSNYYNNPNTETNHGSNKENPIINNEPDTNNNEEQMINNEARLNGNNRNRMNYQSRMNQDMINNRNLDNHNISQQKDNVESENENVINLNPDNSKLVNENLNKNRITYTKQSDSNDFNQENNQSNQENNQSNQEINQSYNVNNQSNQENNQSNNEDSNHMRRMNQHNSELNAASIRNSFVNNDGVTPVIKLSGQYGFNLEKKMNVENGISKQGNEASNAQEQDILSISSVAGVERKQSYNKLYCSNKPYPNIEVKGENMDYAIYLLNDYASSLSELTAITTYCFYNLVLEDEYKEIKDTYRGISIVEMHHLHMLGEIIKKLGVLPRYYSRDMNQITMWSSNYVSGDTDMRTTLLSSIKNEEAGILQYQNKIELIDDEHIKLVLARIILDEEVHVRLLQDLYKKYCPEIIEEIDKN